MDNREFSTWDEVIIGPGLVVANADLDLQTSFACDAHRMARSTFSEASQVSNAEFVIYSPNFRAGLITVAPSIGVVSGLPSLLIGVCTANALTTGFVGEDGEAFAYCPGDGWIYSNNARLVFVGVSLIDTTCGLILDPKNATLVVTNQGNPLGSPVSITANEKWFVGGTVSGDPGDRGIAANFGKTPSLFPITNSQGWSQLRVGLTPILLSSEPYISQPTDSLPHLVFEGRIDRVTTKTSVQRGVRPWMFGSSAPNELVSGSQIQMQVNDPLNVLRKLRTEDVRDQPLGLSRVASVDDALDSAEPVMVAVMDHVETPTQQTKMVYANGKLAQLQIPLRRSVFPPNVDASVAGKPRNCLIGIGRNFTPPCYNAKDRLYSCGDSLVSSFGKERDQGVQIFYGFDFNLTPDGAGIAKAVDPVGKFTVEANSFGGAFNPTAADALGGSGNFASLGAGVGGNPAGWTGQEVFGFGPSWQRVAGVSVKTPNDADCIAWLRHNTFSVPAGASFAYRINILQHPYIGAGVDPFFNPVSVPPARLVIGGISGADIQHLNWANFQLDHVGAYTGVFTNNYTVAFPFVIGFLANDANQGSNGGQNYFVEISDVQLNSVPSLTDNTVFTGPGLDVMLKGIMIQRGPMLPTDYDSAAAQAIDAATGYQHGIYVSENDTPQCADLTPALMASVSGDLFEKRSGQITPFRLYKPEDPAVATDWFLTVSDSRGPMLSYNDYAEKLTTRLQGCRNIDPYTDSDFANVTIDQVPLVLREQLKRSFQWEVTATVQLADCYKAAESAPPLQSTLDLKADGQHAIDYACGFYTDPRCFYKKDFFSPPGRQFEIGQKINFTDPKEPGFEDGLDCVILGVNDTSTENVSTLIFWGLLNAD